MGPDVYHYILTVSTNAEPTEAATPVSEVNTYLGVHICVPGANQSTVLEAIFEHCVGIALHDARGHTITFYRLVPNKLPE